MTTLQILTWFILANAALLLVQTIRVIATYQAVYALSPKDWKRQLPLHVWLMAISFFLYVFGTSWFLAVGEVQFPRAIVYGIAGVIAQYALWNILSYDRRRYSQATNFQDPDEEDALR